jgi:demethylmenaquinone methyltransferase/2-methoxy-6-polyprenyl-1,4-benzoquinol methylase
VATILREWSYRYPWFYNAISWLAALSVGGEQRFRQLALTDIEMTSDMEVLDLCCGNGQATRYLVQHSSKVTGLDASPLAISRAQQVAPDAKYIEGWAESMPFPEQRFDVVHASVALHELQPVQLWRTLQEVHRVLKPGGVFTFVDFHPPFHPLFNVSLGLFILLFETETARQFLKTDVADLLVRVGFRQTRRLLYAGGSLQVIQTYKVEP